MLRVFFLTGVLLLQYFPVSSQDAAIPAAAATAAAPASVDIAAGKTLFKNQCASCHNKNMKDKLTGPALGGVQERWAAYPKEDFFIRRCVYLPFKEYAIRYHLINVLSLAVENSFIKTSYANRTRRSLSGFIDLFKPYDRQYKEFIQWGENLIKEFRLFVTLYAKSTDKMPR
jgi:hypothetical protein